MFAYLRKIDIKCFLSFGRDRKGVSTVWMAYKNNINNTIIWKGYVCMKFILDFIGIILVLFWILKNLFRTWYYHNLHTIHSKDRSDFMWTFDDEAILHKMVNVTIVMWGIFLSFVVGKVNLVEHHFTCRERYFSNSNGLGFQCSFRRYWKICMMSRNIWLVLIRRKE